MNLLSNFWLNLRRLLGPRARLIRFEKKQFGPSFEQLGNDTIRITEGDLKNQEFQLTTTIDEEEAHVFLHREGQEIGHCDIQRDGMEATIVLWNIIVRDDMRHKGLASIMAVTGFRRMLELYPTASFAIRMLRLIKPSERITKIQNVGIGVISRKLGFSPEYDLETLLRQRNIQVIELIQADQRMPPGYRIVLKSFPLVLIAFLVDPLTDKPYPGGHRIYNSLVTPEVAESWASGRMIIIGNGNYMLRQEGINEMINHLAGSEAEAGTYARRIVPV